jgi:hypothetical protein
VQQQTDPDFACAQRNATGEGGSQQIEVETCQGSIRGVRSGADKPLPYNSAVAKKKRIVLRQGSGREMIENANIHFPILLEETSEPNLSFS